MPRPVVDIDVRIRLHKTASSQIATSAVDIGNDRWGVPIDLVVPWDLPYVDDDYAKIEITGRPDGTVSFGRQVGLNYRMAHIRGVQIGPNETLDGTIVTADVADPEPPAFSAGDSTFQADFLRGENDNSGLLPHVRFGPSSATWLGPWEPTGVASSMTRQDLVEDEPGRIVWKCWGRIPNALVGGARNPAANSLMAMWWFYFYPESPLVKWELAIFYSDTYNGSYTFPAFGVPLPNIHVTTPLRLTPHLKWAHQRIVTPANRQVSTVGNRNSQYILDVANAPITFGQGAQWSGFFLDTTRLPHAHADFRAQTELHNGVNDNSQLRFTSWVNAIASRADWDTFTPVWGVIPRPPTSVNAAVYDALTYDYYRSLMDSDRTGDPVFNNGMALWTASGVDNTGAGADRSDWGHGKAAMYWGLAAQGNPDAIELGYFGQMPRWGEMGKFYHQGPDELARTDTYAPRANRVDGSLQELYYTGGGDPNPDNFYIALENTEQDFRVPTQATSDRMWNWVDGKRGRFRGYANAGEDRGHCGNTGLLYAVVTTGSWSMYELLRQQTVMYMYSTKSWGHAEFIQALQDQWRYWRAAQCVVNGYYGDHVLANRQRIVHHLRKYATENNKNGFDGFQLAREAYTNFAAAPGRYVGYHVDASSPNVTPVFSYQVASMWQIGTQGAALKIAELIGDTDFSNHVWASFYSCLAYCWWYLEAPHPAAVWYRAVNDNFNAARMDALVPGWNFLAYVTTPGSTQQRFYWGGDGWAEEWVRQGVTVANVTRDGRSHLAGRTAWNSIPDQGLPAARMFDSRPDGRRVAWAGDGGTDWLQHYGIAAVRLARLATALRVDSRNDFMEQRSQEILQQWVPNYDAMTFAVSNEGWYLLMREMDWLWPSSYESGDTDVVRAPLASHGLAFGAVIGMQVATSSDQILISLSGAANQLATGGVVGMNFIVRPGNQTPQDPLPVPPRGEIFVGGATPPPTVRTPRPGTAFGPDDDRTRRRL